MATFGARVRLAIFVTMASGLTSCVTRLDDLQGSFDDAEPAAMDNATTTTTGSVGAETSGESVWEDAASSHASEAPAPTTPECTDGLLNREGFCVPRVRCAPGTFVSEVDTERVCSPCASGRFSSEYDAADCQPWRECPAGEYVLAAGSATADRACEVCPDGETTTTPNSGECVGARDCVAGTFKSGDACEPCSAGNYCSGKTDAPTPCENDTWDDDSDPATPCVVKTSCAPGQFVFAEGSAVVDRLCYFCAGETFSTESNAVSCADWSTCDAGSYVSLQGTPTTDRACTECSLGTFTAESNRASCQTWTTCSAPSQYVMSAPNAERDRTCGACTSAYTSAADNAAACDVPVPVNLVSNYDFETNTAGWLSWIGTLSVSTARAYTGSGSLLVTGPSTGPAATVLDSVVEAGATYRVSFWVNVGKVSTAPVNITRSLNCNGNTTYLWLANHAAVANGTWTQLAGEFSIPGSCSSPKVQVYAEGGAANVDLYVDNVSVTKAP